MFLHQGLQDIDAATFGYRIMLLFVSMDDCAEDIEKFREWVLFVVPDFVKKRV